MLNVPVRLKRPPSPASAKIAVGVVYVVVMFMTMIDTTIVNVALPSISSTFGIDPSSVDLVVVSYLVSLAVAMSASGWLSDRIGQKRLLLIAVTAFTLASGWCGGSTSLVMLICARVAQGAAGGLLTPLGLAMFLRAFPPSQRTKASRLLLVPMVLAPAGGPIAGGALVDSLNWRWVFLVNLPVGLFALAFAAGWLPAEAPRRRRPLDAIGLLTAAAGLGPLTYGLSVGAAHGWLSPTVMAPLLFGTALTVVHAVRAVRVSAPLLDLRLFADDLYRRTSIVQAFAYAGFSGVLFAIPLLLQNGRGASALASGLVTFPEAVGVIVATQIAAKLLPAIGPRLLVGCGLAFASVAMGCLAVVGPASPLPVVAIAMFLVGFGMAYSMLPSQVVAFATIGKEASTRASTLWSVSAQLSSAFGVALSSVAIAAGHFSGEATSYRPAVVASAVTVLIAVVSTLRLPGHGWAPSDSAGAAGEEDLPEGNDHAK